MLGLWMAGLANGLACKMVVLQRSARNGKYHAAK